MKYLRRHYDQQFQLFIMFLYNVCVVTNASYLPFITYLNTVSSRKVVCMPLYWVDRYFTHLPT